MNLAVVISGIVLAILGLMGYGVWQIIKRPKVTEWPEKGWG